MNRRKSALFKIPQGKVIPGLLLVPRIIAAQQRQRLSFSLSRNPITPARVAAEAPLPL